MASGGFPYRITRQPLIVRLGGACLRHAAVGTNTQIQIRKEIV